MSQSSWKDEVTKPSGFLSVFSFCMGVWLLLVSIINILVGAFAPGQKIEWLGFFNGSSLADAYSEHASITIGSGDILAVALSVAMIFLGAKGIESTVTMDSFVKSLIQRPKHMMDTSKSPLEILSNWMIVGGFLFYLIWSIINTTWVDPGIYSVCIVLIVGGLGIEALNLLGVGNDRERRGGHASSYRPKSGPATQALPRVRGRRPPRCGCG